AVICVLKEDLESSSDTELVADKCARSLRLQCRSESPGSGSRRKPSYWKELEKNAGADVNAAASNFKILDWQAGKLPHCAHGRSHSPASGRESSPANRTPAILRRASLTRASAPTRTSARHRANFSRQRGPRLIP